MQVAEVDASAMGKNEEVRRWCAGEGNTYEGSKIANFDCSSLKAERKQAKIMYK